MFFSFNLIILILALPATVIQAVLIEGPCLAFPSTKNQYFIYKSEMHRTFVPQFYIPFINNSTNIFTNGNEANNNCLEFRWNIKFNKNEFNFPNNCTVSIEFETIEGEMLINDDKLIVASGAITFNHASGGLQKTTIEPNDNTSIQIIKMDELRLIYSCIELNENTSDQSVLVLRPSDDETNQRVYLNFLQDSFVFHQLNNSWNPIDRPMECERECLRLEKYPEVVDYFDAAAGRLHSKSFKRLFVVVVIKLLLNFT